MRRTGRSKGNIDGSLHHIFRDLQAHSTHGTVCFDISFFSRFISCFFIFIFSQFLLIFSMFSSSAVFGTQAWLIS